MAQLCKSGDLSLIPEIHSGRRELTPSQHFSLTSSCELWTTHIYKLLNTHFACNKYTQTHNKLINNFKDCKKRTYAILICKIKSVNAGKASKTSLACGKSLNITYSFFHVNN